jgi:hypothetical protein
MYENHREAARMVRLQRGEPGGREIAAEETPPLGGPEGRVVQSEREARRRFDLERDLAPPCDRDLLRVGRCVELQIRAHLPVHQPARSVVDEKHSRHRHPLPRSDLESLPWVQRRGDRRQRRAQARASIAICAARAP